MSRTVEDRVSDQDPDKHGCTSEMHGFTLNTPESRSGSSFTIRIFNAKNPKFTMIV
jgi:hypothetical protein